MDGKTVPCPSCGIDTTLVHSESLAEERREAERISNSKENLVLLLRHRLLKLQREQFLFSRICKTCGYVFDERRGTMETVATGIQQPQENMTAKALKKSAKLGVLGLLIAGPIGLAAGALGGMATSQSEPSDPQPSSRLYRCAVCRGFDTIPLSSPIGMKLAASTGNPTS